MSEIRERLEEIRRLVEKWREGEVLADDIVWEIHEDATKALALLDESGPVAWMVQHHGDEGVQYVELWTRKHRAERQVESLRAGYPDDRFSITPLYPALTGQEGDANV